MKKLIPLLIISCSILLTPSQIFAGLQQSIVITENGSDTERVNVLLKQLYKLRSTDRSTLSKTERKELRKELRIKKAQLQEGGRRHYGGVYISGTAIIIIILLIILL